MLPPYRTLSVIFAVTFVTACGDEPGREHAAGARTDAVPADTAVDSAAVARARSAANGLGQELQAKLFAALDSSGPAVAVTYCADSAQAWTARHAQAGVYVRRVSQRVRNPANRPDSIEAGELVRLDSLHRAGALPGEIVRARVGEGGERFVDYMRPIVVQERCLACHGQRGQMAPEVRDLLAARYPADEATGYSAGDLRGMLTVRVRQ
jgi:hypothetical protein